LVHKVQVSFNDEQWKVIKKLRPELGNTDAELVRNIILSWLSEKSMISTNAKLKLDL